MLRTHLVALLISANVAAIAQVPAFSNHSQVVARQIATGGSVGRLAFKVKLREDLFSASSAGRFQEAKRIGKKVRLLMNPSPIGAAPAVVDAAHVWPDGGTVTWVGHFEASVPGSFSLAQTGTTISGHILTPEGKVYNVRGDQSGTFVEEFEANRPWSCSAAGPASARIAASDSVVSVPSSVPGLRLPAEADTTVTVDVLVVYSSTARAQAGGETAIVNGIREAVAYTNQAYANTGLANRINLVGTQEVAFYGDGTCATALEAITYADGEIDSVHSLRDSLGADLVDFWISDGDCGGLAWVMQSNSSSFASHGYSVVNAGMPTWWRNIAFAHELGHNMGAAHDRANASVSGLFPYSYGYQSTEATPYFRDIMAYECSGVSCPVQPFFANPDLLQYGRPAGRPSTTFDSADLRQTFLQSVPTVASFRSSSGNTLQVSPSVVSIPATSSSGFFDMSGTGQWSVTWTTPWITTVSPVTGSGPSRVSFTVAANNTTTSRSGAIHVNGMTVLVQQAGAPACTAQFIGVPETTSGTVTDACFSPVRPDAWSALYSFSGLAGQRIAVAASSAEFDTYLYLLGPDGTVLRQDDDGGPWTNSRIPADSGYFALPATGTYTIDVTTFGAGEGGQFTLSVTTQQACSYTITPSGPVTVPGAQAEFTATVATSSGCSWTATSGASWLAVVAGASDTGNGTVTYRVTENTTGTNRTTNLTIGGQTVQVTQTSLPSCVISAIVPGPEVHGTLTAGNGCRSSNRGAGFYAARYSFQATAGVAVQVLLQSSVFNTYLYLTGPGGSPVLQDGDSAGNGNSVIPGLEGFVTLPATGTYTIEVTTQTAGQSGAFTLLLTNQPTVNPPLGALRFVPVTPCRALDTRLANGQLGGPALQVSAVRDFPIASSTCGVPTSARAYSLNVTAVPLGPLGYLTVWPSGQQRPVASTLNSMDGRVKANASIVMAGINDAISIFATHATHVVVDINGYFVPATDASALAFHALTPCRVVDTRLPTGLLSGPHLAAWQRRSFPMLASGCGIPVDAHAYSVNFTVVPRGTLGYLSVWPTGVSMPVVSTLNSLTGAVVANAAIVPAGSGGSIDVLATDATDVIIDINGFFGAAGSSGTSFYALTPCRALDTRVPDGAQPMIGARTVNTASSGCAIPTNAQAVALNATAIPAGQIIGYMSLWAAGQAQPLVSTLNSLDGSIVSNAAIVPVNTGRALTAFTTDPAHLILDLAGYFAP